MMTCKTCRRPYALDARAFNSMFCSQECMRAGTAPMVTPEVQRLDAECPRHGLVRPVCPKCAGEVGGRAHKDSRWGSREMNHALGIPLRKRHPR